MQLVQQQNGKSLSSFVGTLFCKINWLIYNYPLNISLQENMIQSKGSDMPFIIHAKMFKDKRFLTFKCIGIGIINCDGQEMQSTWYERVI